MDFLWASSQSCSSQISHKRAACLHSSDTRYILSLCVGRTWISQQCCTTDSLSIHASVLQSRRECLLQDAPDLIQTYIKYTQNIHEIYMKYTKYIWLLWSFWTSDCWTWRKKTFLFHVTNSLCQTLNWPLCSSSVHLRDDDDINDVASMAGVNLNEENARILATSSELVGTKIRSCKDESFLPAGLLHRRILDTGTLTCHLSLYQTNLTGKSCYYWL